MRASSSPFFNLELCPYPQNMHYWERWNLIEVHLNGALVDIKTIVFILITPLGEQFYLYYTQRCWPRWRCRCLFFWWWMIYICCAYEQQQRTHEGKMPRHWPATAQVYFHRIYYYIIIIKTSGQKCKVAWKCRSLHAKIWLVKCPFPLYYHPLFNMQSILYKVVFISTIAHRTHLHTSFQAYPLWFSMHTPSYTAIYKHTYIWTR